MRVLVTGAAGMLGRALCENLKGAHTVIGVDIGDFDLTETSCIARIIETQPEIVCHLAAFTHVDGCEKNPEKAYRSNVVATRNVAVACREAKCSMLYLSTDYVFDGQTDRPYSEDDKPSPLNMYGRTKLIGEWFVERIVSQNYRVRSSWLYGEGGRNFVDTILALAEEKDVLEVVDDQTGSPTYTKDLASALMNLIESKKFGIYHLTNNGECSWYDFAVSICKKAGVEGCAIKRVKTALSARPANRPAYSVLDNRIYAQTFGGYLRSWEEALEEYLEGRSGGGSNG